MWSIVEIQNINTKEVETFKIVGSTEADILAEIPKISNESPVWKALLWKKKLDKVKVKAQSGIFEYKINSVK
jgi:transcription elongation factor GreA